ncbi:MAG: hypothetical protein QW512_00465 [Thermofilaceae archaeon]
MVLNVRVDGRVAVKINAPFVKNGNFFVTAKHVEVEETPTEIVLCVRMGAAHGNIRRGFRKFVSFLEKDVYIVYGGKRVIATITSVAIERDAIVVTAKKKEKISIVAARRKVTAYDLLKRYYDEALERLSEGFENFLKTAQEIEVIEWQDEFAVADKNPEVILQLEELEKKLKNKEIDEETYKEAVRKIASVPASITMGVAFIDEKKVSFRTTPPPLRVLLHEIGHVHYKVKDLIWSSTFGGAELLLQAHVAKICNTSDEKLKDLISFMKLCYDNPEEAHSWFVSKCALFIEENSVARHVGAVMAYFGTLITENAPIDPTDPEWLNVPVTTRLLVHAVAEILTGLCYREPGCTFLAKRLDWIY